MTKKKKKIKCPYCEKTNLCAIPQYDFKNITFDCDYCSKTFKIDKYGNPKKKSDFKIKINLFGVNKYKIKVFMISILILLPLWFTYTFLLSPRFTTNSFLLDLEKGGIYQAYRNDYFVSNYTMEWEDFISISNESESYEDIDLDKKFEIWKSMVEYDNDYADVFKYGSIVSKGYISYSKFLEMYEDFSFSDYEIIDYEYKNLKEVKVFGKIILKYKSTSRILGQIPYGKVKFNLKLKHGRDGWKITSFLPDI